MKEYKTLFVKAIVFIALAVAVDILAGIGLRGLEKKALDHSPYGMAIENAMWKVQSDAIIMGASDASHSFVPRILEDSLGITFYNCGKDGCRFYIQNAMINGILNRYSPKLILWSFSPDELCTPSELDNGNLSQLNPFYKDDDFVRQVLKTKSKYEPIKLLSESYVYNSRMLPYLYKASMPDYDFEYGGYAPLGGTNKDLKIKKREWHGHYDVDVEKTFRETIARCKDAGVEVIIVFAPRLETENHQDRETYKALKRVVADYELNIVEDLYHYQGLMDSQYFKDNAHLNAKGAPIFTALLASEILRTNNLEGHAEDSNIWSL